MADAKTNLTIGFIGNPNCGKTTLFNAYTGANLKVANWPGVTVEKVEGAIRHQHEYPSCRSARDLQSHKLHHGRNCFPEIHPQ